ncbi:hypothetical protein D8B46_05790 [Candidatus Gracilibacteria bacterium]|nr:MAG: hypothetical protein D8B46_05790 [Candidatus Gracilibacteria bacterium]
MKIEFYIFYKVMDKIQGFLYIPEYIDTEQIFKFLNLFDESGNLIFGENIVNIINYIFYNSGIGYANICCIGALLTGKNIFLGILSEFIGIFIGSFLIFLGTSIFEYFFKTPKIIKSQLGKNLIIYGIFIKIIPLLGLLSSFFIALSDKSFSQKLKFIFFGCIFNLIINELYLNTNIFSMGILSEFPIVLKAFGIFFIISIIFFFSRKYFSKNTKK